MPESTIFPCPKSATSISDTLAYWVRFVHGGQAIVTLMRNPKETESAEDIDDSKTEKTTIYEYESLEVEVSEKAAKNITEIFDSLWNEDTKSSGFVNPISRAVHKSLEKVTVNSDTKELVKVSEITGSVISEVTLTK